MNKKLGIEKNCHLALYEEPVYFTFITVAKQGVFVRCIFEVGVIFFS